MRPISIKVFNYARPSAAVRFGSARRLTNKKRTWLTNHWLSRVSGLPSLAAQTNGPRLTPRKQVKCGLHFRCLFVARWGLHPLESAALSRRTPIPDMGNREYRIDRSSSIARNLRSPSPATDKTEARSGRSWAAAGRSWQSTDPAVLSLRHRARHARSRWPLSFPTTDR
jgi:hypothetical protein